MKKIILSFLVFAFFAGTAIAQDRTITGTVTGKEDGLSIPGASVKVQGTQKGTQTSSGGKYVIVVPTSATSLEFSYLGFITQVVPIGSSTVINVALAQDTKTLTEVVVTALGIKREAKALGYSAQSVKGDDLTKADQGDVLKSLSGKIAGVQVTSSSGTPGASSYIQLRGQNSLTGNNQPLFVIDGNPIDNSQNYSGDPSDGKNNLLQGATNSNRGADVDPNDIESITVLKGPAAAAIYGIDAANGAILITTI